MLELVYSALEASSATNRLLFSSFDVVNIVEVDDGDAGGGHLFFFLVAIGAGAVGGAGSLRVTIVMVVRVIRYWSIVGKCGLIQERTTVASPSLSGF